MEGLISHVDTTRVPREALLTLLTPEPTATHVPIPHHRLVTTLHETFAMRRVNVAHEDYAVSKDTNRFFGVMTLETEEGGVRFAVGVRNSHEKSISVGLVAGYRVMVCDNMAFFGQGVAIARKHTRRLALEDTVALAVEKIQRTFEPMRKQIAAFRATELADDDAKVVIYRAFIERKLDVPKHLAPDVHDLYFQPKYPEFEPRTLWSLANAFTSAFQTLEPIPRFQATTKLTGFLDEVELAPLPSLLLPSPFQSAEAQGVSGVATERFTSGRTRDERREARAALSSRKFTMGPPVPRKEPARGGPKHPVWVKTCSTPRSNARGFLSWRKCMCQRGHVKSARA